MRYLVIGESGSGKSCFAEDLVVKLRGEKKAYYIATMEVCDEESKMRVERHRLRRCGKGFITIEQQKDLMSISGEIEKGSVLLLECVTNLTANEIFLSDGIIECDMVVDCVMSEITGLGERVSDMVIVTSDISSWGTDYDESTIAYIDALGRINEELEEVCDKVFAVTGGIPEKIKG